MNACPMMMAGDKHAIRTLPACYELYFYAAIITRPAARARQLSRLPNDQRPPAPRAVLAVDARGIPCPAMGLATSVFTTPPSCWSVKRLARSIESRGNNPPRSFP